MSLVVVAALTFALQSSGEANASSEGDERDAPTTAEMIEMVVTRNFATMDMDRSGFIDPDEIAALGGDQHFIPAGDENGDSKLDEAEYRNWLAPIIAQRGAEGRRFVEDYLVKAGDRNLQPGHVPATTPEISNIIQATFRHLDANGSGLLEGEESALHALPGPQRVYRRDAQGNVVPTGETIEQSEAQIRAGFYAQADKDRDGKVTFEEYYQWSAPRIARQGIPADMQANMNLPIQPEG